MSKIIIDTNIRQISTTGKFKPNSPTWLLVNKSGANLIVDGIYVIRTDESFGIDNSAIAAVALKEGWAIENNTEYNVSFLDASKLLPSGGIDKVESTKGIALLFETSYKLVK